MSTFGFLFYNFIKIAFGWIFALLYPFKVVNGSVIPKDGGALIVGNHSSWLDTLFLSVSMKRDLWFCTGDFILDVPVMGWLVKQLPVIPMRKNSGQKAIEQAVKKIQEGCVVCIFPEGTLTKDGNLQRFRNGIAHIQRQANVPLIPFYLHGAINTWSVLQKKPAFFKKVKLTYGEPFVPVSEKDGDIANEIRNKVLELSSISENQ